VIGISSSPAEALASSSSDAAEMAVPLRALYWLCCVWAVASMWLAPHLPQIDLPQHAGQVALLRDLLAGHSPWAGELRVNLLTPYLLGYLSLLALSWAMPIESAIALLYGLFFLAFVAICVGLRRRLGADRRLDWLFLPAFFGIPWHWGFLTFLLASVIGLWFLSLTYGFVERPSMRRAFGIVAVGVALLFSHGLVFLYAVPMGLLIVAVSIRGELRQRWLLLLAPFTLLLLGFALYKIAVIDPELKNAADSGKVVWGGWQSRLMALSGSSLLRPLLATVVAAISYAAPWAIGLRPRRSLRIAIPFLWTAALMVVYPEYVSGATNFYDRFSFLLLPLYAVMFGPAPARQRPAWLSAVHVQLVLFGVCATVLGRETMHNMQFAREMHAVDRLLDAIEPGRKLLYVPVAVNRADLPLSYLHYPLWYQARRGGFVEFNFASLLPQIVRFRDFKKHLGAEFSWNSSADDWKMFANAGYDYALFSTQEPLDPAVLASPTCRLDPVSAIPDWALFRIRCAQR
jgi:hypothetical protein